MSKEEAFMKNKINIILILMIIVFSTIFGYVEKKDYSYLNKAILYTEDSEWGERISYNTYGGSGTIKAINNYNRDFSKIYSKGPIKININPISANKLIFEMIIHSSNKLTPEEVNSLQNEYMLFIKEKSEDIKFINVIAEDEFSYAPSKVRNALFRGVSALLYVGAALYLGKKLPKKTLKAMDNNKVKLAFTVISLISLVFNFQFLLAVFMMLAALFIHQLYKNQGDKLFLGILAVGGFIIRVGAIIAMVAFNLYRYGTKLSYLQPDEMFYYETGNKIAVLLSSFKLPNLKEITEVTQYAYNLFAGVVSLLNGESFYALKLVNALLCSLLMILLYNFAMRLFKNRAVARLSAILVVFMPTMILFSTFALRDIMIALFIFLWMGEIICFDTREDLFGRILRIIVYSIVLWFLRNYALILLIMIAAFYGLLRLCLKLNIKIIYVLAVGIVGLTLALTIASKLYTFSLLKLFINYFKREGIIRYVTGIVLSITNLDFLTNTSATLYTSVKTLMVRMLYPETLFLIITLPSFVMGVREGAKKSKAYTYAIVVMFIGFITIYKLQYGGWFLRTQLQIFPYQYLFISIGIIEVLRRLDFTNRGKGMILISRILDIE